MNEIRLKNYRCFKDAQTARLAPLTLLVGENSTGKTSFLALARALLDIEKGRVPDFKASPYDLGSFREIAHRSGDAGEPAKGFDAGFSRISSANGADGFGKAFRDFDARFEERGTAPFPVVRRVSGQGAWIEEISGIDQPPTVCVGTARGEWEFILDKSVPTPFGSSDDYLHSLPIHLVFTGLFGGSDHFKPMNGSPKIESDDLEMIVSALPVSANPSPFASAPARSKPRRTYDPARAIPDPEGDYVPMYLAETLIGDGRKWEALKGRLERFGEASGLFDEISINRFGDSGGPFQLQFRKYAGDERGPRHNLIDVGYGVSQALPLLTELLREDAPGMFLLQQPEVHLHPRAQAELGSLFCQLAGPERQFIVETHSDHLMNRVRMDVRDQVCPLKPDDVSILYFEREGLGARIYCMGYDKEGNLIGAPDSYGTFFMEETTRTIWKRYRKESN